MAAVPAPDPIGMVRVAAPAPLVAAGRFGIAELGLTEDGTPDFQDLPEALRPVHIARLRERSRATVLGHVRSVTFSPAGGAPAFAAEVADTTGTVRVVWLGRREIPGIVPGRRLVLRGLVTKSGSEWCLRDPRYELLPPLRRPRKGPHR
ncbi:MAG: hypothetical protein LBM66_07370 [Bifidobacteriaceae bacterium]|jgi:hypothetical protein|nr:hypothetical protein [Bifidobacteriaceae bacterium]